MTMTLPLAVYFVGLVGGILVIALASTVSVTNIITISEKRRLSKSVLGFLLVAFSTSLPELFVAVNAIIIGNMSVSLGDLLGSNITNICLIIGLSLVVGTTFNHKRDVTIRESESKEFITGLMLLSITLLSLLYIQYISQLIGVLLLGIFVSYSYILIRRRKIVEEEISPSPTGGSIKKQVYLIILGLAGVIISAKIVLESAIQIATFFDIPASVIGATVVALGTSLPELAVDTRAAYRGYLNLAMGDIVGSCFLNSTLILGILLVFTPFQVNVLVLSDLILFSVVSNLLLWYAIDTGRLKTNFGLLLLVLYAVNVLSLLGIIQLRPNF